VIAHDLTHTISIVSDELRSFMPGYVLRLLDWMKASSPKATSFPISGRYRRRWLGDGYRGSRRSGCWLGSNEAMPVPAMSGHHPVLASIASRSFFLIGELLLGNLSETVVVVGNAPHDRPGVLVGHLVGNRASFLPSQTFWKASPRPPRVREPPRVSERRQHQLSKACRA